MKAIRFLALAAVFGLGVVALQSQGTAAADGTPKEIKAAGWINSTGETLAALKGKKAVVVEFWATWCPPCRKSIPHLNKLHEKYGDKVTIIGLSNESKDKVEGFAKKFGMKYVVGYGSSSYKDYGVKRIPIAFVINKAGEIVWSGSPSKIDEHIAKVAAE